MINFRISGLPKEVEAFAKKLKVCEGCKVIEESKNYRNRDASELVRRYIDVDCNNVQLGVSTTKKFENGYNLTL